MKIAVIGVGYWGKKHVEEYVNLGQNVTICDESEKNIFDCIEKFSELDTKQIGEILNDDEIEGVSICTPNETHFKIAKLCLKAKKHVFLEKPIATNLEDANELIKISEENNVVLQIGHLYRFNNSIMKTKKIINENTFGTVHSVYFSWTNFEPIFSDRGIILDLGIHPVDIIDYIFGGSIQNIKCRGWGIRQDRPEFATINYQLTTQKNELIFVNIELSWLNPIKKREMTILSNENTLNVQCVEQKISFINNKSKDQKEIEIKANNTIQDELSFFIDMCKNKKMILEPYPNSKIGKNILDIILQAERENSDKK